MLNTTGRFHLYSDTNKFATGNVLYQNRRANPSLSHMPEKDYQKPQEIIPLQN